MDRKAVVKGVLIAAVLVALAACVFGVIHYLDHRAPGGAKAERESAEPDPEFLYLGDLEYEVTDNIKTYLIVGTDGAGTKPNAKHYHGPMADYQLLLVIDKTTGTYGFVQIDRDLMTEVSQINEKGEEEIALSDTEQICTATWYGKDLDQGLTNLVDCVSYVLGGIEIDGYYSINMDDIAALNHAVGGVTVTIEDDFSELDDAMVPGAKVHLTDEQAVLFVRARKEVGDGTNESRMRRQKAYMEALMDEARGKMAKNSKFAAEVYAELQSIATTNIPGSQVSGIASQIYKSKSLGIKDIAGEHKEGRIEGDKKDYMQFYYDESSVEEIMKELCNLGEGREYL